MYHHIVLFKLKTIDSEIKNEMKRMFLEMPSNMTFIREIKVGIDELHTKRSCDISLYVKFDNYDDYLNYNDNPHHLKVKEYVATVNEASYTVDYSD